MVAPVVSTPPQVVGSRNRSFNQAIEIDSSRVTSAIGVQRRQKTQRLVGDESEGLLRLVLGEERIGHVRHGRRASCPYNVSFNGCEREQYANALASETRRMVRGGTRTALNSPGSRLPETEAEEGRAGRPVQRA